MKEEYNKEEALKKAMVEYPHFFRKTTMTGMTPREKRNELYILRLNTIRDLRYKEFKTLQEIANSLKPKITRQAVRDLLINHFPLEQLIDVVKSRKSRDRKLSIEKGDRVWFLMPHNGTIEKISKDGGYTIKPDTLGDHVTIGEFSNNEITKI